jgi:hypothetical protein
MKHIFTIHSHVTFLVAYSIIKYLNLDKEDVILLSSKYKVSVGGFRVEEAFQTRFKGLKDKLFTLNAPRAHDRYIDKLTGGQPFTAYVDLMSYYQKILITHPKCKSFHFIEEGNGAYQEFDDLTDLTWPERSTSYRNKGYLDGTFFKAFFRVLRGYNLRLLSIPYNYMAFTNFEGLKFYCFSDSSYYNAPAEKKIILRPEPNEELKQMALNPGLDKQVIWIDGSNGRYTGLTEDYYHRAIDRAIIILKERGVIKDKTYVKLRMGEDETENYLIKALKRSGILVEVLPGATVLEAFFVVSYHCTIIGNLSAALEYAHCFGHKTYSIYSLFEKRVPTFFDRMKGFWEHTELLKNS